MFLFISLLLIGIGTLFLIFSLFPIFYLVKTLPSKNLRTQWKFLSILVSLFLVSYVAYGVEMWLTYEEDNHGHLVPTIFCFGAIFVLSVAKLSERTARDLNEIAILKKENITDPLMGIFNRRHFEERLDQELFKSEQQGQYLSLLLLDIDHFKHINDTYGHTKGDDVLIAFGKLIQNIARQTDIIARYGGEEICIIAPKSSKKAAMLLAERIRSKIEHTVLSICMATQEEINVTVSIGVATHQSIAKGSFIEEADKALYCAKENGRNQVVHFSDLEASSSSCRS